MIILNFVGCATILELVFICSTSHEISADCGSNIDFNKWSSISPPNDTYALIQAQAYTRHGDRTIATARYCWLPAPIWDCSQTLTLQPTNTNPAHTLPNQFNFQLQRINGTEYYPGNCIIGQLTLQGYTQHKNLGIGLKERYSNYYSLLPETYKINSNTSNEINKDIRLRADNSQRTQHSAMALFTGLYENINSDQYQSSSSLDLDIHLETQDEETDILNVNSGICPQTANNLQNAQNSQEYKNHFANVTLKYLHECNSFIYGGNISTLTDLGFIHDCGNAFSCHNYSVPDQFNQTLYNNLVADRSWIYNYFNNYPNRINASKYQVGPWLSLIYQQLLQAVSNVVDINIRDNNNDNQVPRKKRTHVGKDSKQEDDDSLAKFYLYSGHDDNMVAMLGALGYNVTDWVPYASLISIELFVDTTQMGHSDTGDIYVLTSYNGEILTLPEPCDCNTNEYNLCSWKLFQSFIEQMIPSKEECPGMH